MASLSFDAIAYEISKVEKGDTQTARFLVSLIVKCLKENKPIEGTLLSYLTKALEEVANGESADKAFNLVSTPHCCRANYEQRDMNIAEEVWRESYGKTYAAAYESVAKTHNMEPKRVKEIWLHWKDGIKANHYVQHQEHYFEIALRVLEESRRQNTWRAAYEAVAGMYRITPRDAKEVWLYYRDAIEKDPNANHLKKV